MVDPVAPVWAWEALPGADAPDWVFVTILSPLVVGLLVLACAIWIQRVPRAVVLLLCGVAIYYARLVLPNLEADRWWLGEEQASRRVREMLTYACAFLGWAAIAVGSHLRSRESRPDAVRWLVGAGALVLLIIVAHAVMVELSGSRAFFRDPFTRTAWPELTVLGAYGVLGLFSALKSAAVTNTIARWMARGALLALPALFIAKELGMPNHLVEAGPIESVAKAMRSGLLLAGTLLLLPLGVAAWIEAARYSKSGATQPTR